MQLFEMLAEQKIQEAIERGELDDLPGTGKPLEIDDDPLVPEDQRVAYRVPPGAGVVASVGAGADRSARLIGTVVVPVLSSMDL